MEVIAAMAVVAIGLVALIRLQLISINATASAETATRATLIAQEKIDEAFTKPFEKITVSSGTTRQAGRDFQWQRRITDTMPMNTRKLDMSSMREINVKVSWKQGSGNKEIRLKTFRAKEELQ